MNKRVKTVHINTEISNNLQLISGAKLLNNHFEDYPYGSQDHSSWLETIKNSLNCGLINRSDNTWHDDKLMHFGWNQKELVNSMLSW